MRPGLLTSLFRLVTSRSPSSLELDALKAFFASEKTTFEKEPERALTYLNNGEQKSKRPTQPHRTSRPRRRCQCLDEYGGWGDASVGLLGYWVIGLLGYWVIGLLGYWVIGLLGYWVIGLLGYWVIGLLGYWVIGKVKIIDLGSEMYCF